MNPEIAKVTTEVLNATSFSQQPIAQQSAVNDGAYQRRWSGIRNAISPFVRWARSLGPYVAIELILPGGSIIAVALWTYRHRIALRRRDAATQSVAATASSTRTLACVSTCNGR